MSCLATIRPQGFYSTNSSTANRIDEPFRCLSCNRLQLFQHKELFPKLVQKNRSKLLLNCQPKLESECFRLNRKSAIRSDTKCSLSNATGNSPFPTGRRQRCRPMQQ